MPRLWAQRTMVAALALATAAGAVSVAVSLRVASADSEEAVIAPVARVAVFVGDSYTAGAHSTAPDKRFTALIARAHGWTEVNLGRGGTGYITSIADPTAAPYACGLGYCPTYTEMIAEVAAADPDVVVVSGGRNDVLRDFSEWAAGVEAFYASLRAAVPDARIIATSPIWDTGPTPMMVVAMCTVIQRAVTSVGGTYVDIGDPLQGRSDRVSGDGVHPNDLGHAAIAEAFAAAYTRTDAATFPQPAASSVAVSTWG